MGVVLFPSALIPMGDLAIHGRLLPTVTDLHIDRYPPMGVRQMIPFWILRKP